MKPTKGPPRIETIIEAWESAQRQLQSLREKVDTAVTMANAATLGAALQGDLDLAYRDLGEAVWRAVQEGRWKVPPTAAKVAEPVATALERLRAHHSSVNDLIHEGDLIAKTLREKKLPVLSRLAPPPRKR